MGDRGQDRRTGDPSYDAIFATGTPRPDFAKVLLTPSLTQFLAGDPRAVKAHFVFQSAEALALRRDG